MKRAMFAMVWGLALGVYGFPGENHWHYPFDGDGADAGPHGSHGTCSPGVAFVDGRIGPCARFSGSDFISLPLDLNATAELSFGFWLKPEGNQPGPYYAMVLSSDADTYGRGLAINLADDACQVWLDDRYLDTGVAAPPVGQWQHVGVTYAPGDVRLYLNGREVWACPDWTNAPPYNDSTNLLVGLRNLFFDRGLNGCIDELHVFDRALSPAEVAALAGDAPGLLAYYPFEDNLEDASPNAFHGIPSTNMIYENSVQGRGLVLPPKPHVRLPLDLNSYGDMSFSFWLKINGPCPLPYYGMFFSTDNNTFGRGLGVNAADNRFMIWHDDNFEYPGIPVPEVGVWRHVGMTYTPGRACFYLDGRCVDTNTTHKNPPPYNDAPTITLGLRNLFMDRGADFSIDELRIYGRPLSAGEMQALAVPGAAITGIVVAGAATIRPQRTAAFVCFACLDNGLRVDVTSGARFFVEPGAAANEVWFVDNLLHCGLPAGDALCRVHATYAHDGGVAVSAVHEVRVQADESGCLLAHYPLDGDAIDAGGNGLDGAVSGAVVSTDAVAGVCFRFNGRNTISLPVDLNGHEEMSYSLWFKILGTQPGPYYAMLLSSDNNTYGRGVAITLTNSNFQLWFDNGFEDTGTHTPAAGEWHHLAATYRPGENIFYYDGAEVYRDAARTGTAPFNDATNLLLGMRNLFFDRGFNGLIDEVKIFGCALSAAAVQEEYAALAGDHVNRPPELRFALDPPGGVAPCKIVFDFSESCDPDGRIARSEVDPEGDGVYEHAVEGAGRIAVEYSRPGDYATGVRVVDNLGATTAAMVPVLVGGAAPAVVLQVEPAAGPAPLTVAFEAQAIPAASNLPIANYEWDFDGDGVADEISAEPRAVHVYGSAGEYRARVAAADVAGVAGHGERTVTVRPPVAPPPCNPVLEFFPPAGFSPLPVRLCVLNAGGCVFESIEWDFEGDGQVDVVSASSTISRVYAEPGKYWPVARVVFADGARVVLTNLLQVSESPDLRVWISQPRDDQTLWGDAIALHANTAPGNQTGAVKFQYRPAEASAWTDIGDWLEPPPYSFVREWDVTALPAGSSVFLRAVARDLGDRQVFSDTVRVWIAPPETGAADGVSAAGDLLGYRVDAARRCEYRQANGFAIAIPPRATPSNRLVSVRGGPAPGVRSPSGFDGLALLPGGYRLDFGADPLRQAVEVVLPYADQDDDGRVDGTFIHESTLNAFDCDAAGAMCRKTLRSDVDPVRNLVRTSVAGSGDIRLAGDPNLFLPVQGCVLAATGETPAAPAANLADGNPLSYWRVEADRLPVEVVFTFTHRQVAILRGISCLNAGGAAAEPLRTYRIATSLNGVDFVRYAAGELAASDRLQDVGVAAAVTCRYVKVELVAGWAGSGATLHEIRAVGSLTCDSDADGLEDVWEIRCFDALAHDGGADPDADGLDNAREQQLGLDPTRADTDGDGYPDGSEYVAGTGGADSSDLLTLAVDRAAPDADGLVLRWQSAPGRLYSVECFTNMSAPCLETPAWVVGGDGTVKSFTNPAPAGSRFFRLKVGFE